MITTIKIKNILLKNTFLKNFSVLAVSRVLSKVLAVFISIKIARVLEPTLFGTYNLLHVQYTIFAVIGSLGLSKVITRDVARDTSKLNDVFLLSLTLRGIGVILACLIFSVYYFFYNDYDIFIFLLVVVNIFARAFFDLFESIAFGLEKMEFSAFVNLVGTLAFLLTLLAFPSRMLTLHLIFGLFVLFFVFKAVIYYFLINGKGQFSNVSFQSITKHKAFQFLKESFPYYYLGLLTLLSSQVPILFLQFRSGVEQIGFFNIAVKILLPISILFNTVLAAIFPKLAKLFHRDFPVFVKNTKMVFILLAIFGTLAVFGISLFKREIVLLLYGAEYASATAVIFYQSWYVLVYGCVCFMGTILSAIDRQKELGYLSIVCTIIQLPVLWIGAKGGAQFLSAGFLGTMMIIFVIHFFVIKKLLRNKLSGLFFTKILGVLVGGYLTASLIPSSVNLGIKFFIFALVVIAVCYILYMKYRFALQKMFRK